MLSRVLPLAAFITAGGMWASPLALATPLITHAPPVTFADAKLVKRVWHSGMPHRRVIGDRVYGGDCPPGGCPLYTQPDLLRRGFGDPRRDPRRYEEPGNYYRDQAPTRRYRY